jgi:hypothetical protein
MTMSRPTDGWFKSSRSSEHANCVEVRLGGRVGVRDTKDRAGGQLALARGEWAAFVASVATRP